MNLNPFALWDGDSTAVPLIRGAQALIAGLFGYVLVALVDTTYAMGGAALGVSLLAGHVAFVAAPARWERRKIKGTLGIVEALLIFASVLTPILIASGAWWLALYSV